MSNKVEARLSQYNANDLSVKLCSATFGVLPFAPPYLFYKSIDEAAGRLGAGPDVAAQARKIAETEEVGQAMWVAEALDTSDQLIAGYAGVKNLLSVFSSSGGGGTKKRTFEADQEQAADAALKGIGLAYIIYKLFPGEVVQKVNAFKDLPAGKEAALFFVVGEVALPFSDNLVEAGSGLVKRLVNSQEAGIAEKFSQFAGSGAVSQAKQVMSQLDATLESYVGQVKSHHGPLLDKIKSVLPTGAQLMNIADSASGAAASGVDLLPVWSLLGARLAAEACVYRAQQGG